MHPTSLECKTRQQEANAEYNSIRNNTNESRICFQLHWNVKHDHREQGEVASNSSNELVQRPLRSSPRTLTRQHMKSLYGQGKIRKMYTLLKMRIKGVYNRPTRLARSVTLFSMTDLAIYFHLASSNVCIYDLYIALEIAHKHSYLLMLTLKYEQNTLTSVHNDV